MTTSPLDSVLSIVKNLERWLHRIDHNNVNDLSNRVITSSGKIRQQFDRLAQSLSNDLLQDLFYCSSQAWNLSGVCEDHVSKEALLALRRVACDGMSMAIDAPQNTIANQPRLLQLFSARSLLARLSFSVGENNSQVKNEFERADDVSSKLSALISKSPVPPEGSFLLEQSKTQLSHLLWRAEFMWSQCHRDLARNLLERAIEILKTYPDGARSVIQSCCKLSQMTPVETAEATVKSISSVAAEWLTLALDVHSQHPSADLPNLSSLYRQLATAHLKAEKFEEALKVARSAQEASQQQQQQRQRQEQYDGGDGHSGSSKEVTVDSLLNLCVLVRANMALAHKEENGVIAAHEDELKEHFFAMFKILPVLFDSDDDNVDSGKDSNIKARLVEQEALNVESLLADLMLMNSKLTSMLYRRLCKSFSDRADADAAKLADAVAMTEERKRALAKQVEDSRRIESLLTVRFISSLCLVAGNDHSEAAQIADDWLEKNHPGIAKSTGVASAAASAAPATLVPVVTDNTDLGESAKSLQPMNVIEDHKRDQLLATFHASEACHELLECCWSIAVKKIDEDAHEGALLWLKRCLQLLAQPLVSAESTRNQHDGTSFVDHSHSDLGKCFRMAARACIALSRLDEARSFLEQARQSCDCEETDYLFFAVSLHAPSSPHECAELLRRICGSEMACASGKLELCSLEARQANRLPILRTALCASLLKPSSPTRSKPDSFVAVLVALLKEYERLSDDDRAGENFCEISCCMALAVRLLCTEEEEAQRGSCTELLRFLPLSNNEEDDEMSRGSAAGSDGDVDMADASGSSSSFSMTSQSLLKLLSDAAAHRFSRSHVATWAKSATGSACFELLINSSWNQAVHAAQASHLVASHALFSACAAFARLFGDLSAIPASGNSHAQQSSLSVMSMEFEDADNSAAATGVSGAGSAQKEKVRLEQYALSTRSQILSLASCVEFVRSSDIRSLLNVDGTGALAPTNAEDSTISSASPSTAMLDFLRAQISRIQESELAKGKQATETGRYRALCYYQFTLIALLSPQRSASEQEKLKATLSTMVNQAASIVSQPSLFQWMATEALDARQHDVHRLCLQKALSLLSTQGTKGSFDVLSVLRRLIQSKGVANSLPQFKEAASYLQGLPQEVVLNWQLTGKNVHAGSQSKSLHSSSTSVGSNGVNASAALNVTEAEDEAGLDSSGPGVEATWLMIEAFNQAIRLTRLRKSKEAIPWAETAVSLVKRVPFSARYQAKVVHAYSELMKEGTPMAHEQ